MYDYPNDLTKEDVKMVFSNKVLSDVDLTLLRYHYQMPHHTATATQLGQLLGYLKYTAVNLHYARIAKKISKFTGKYPFKGESGKYYWWSLLTTVEPIDRFEPWTLRKIVIDAIEELKLFQGGENVFPEEIDTEVEIYKEGAVRKIVVNAYERNMTARNKCLEAHGLSCKVCGFNFEDVYGEIGSNFIHVHHIVPLAEIKKNYEVNPVTDLVPICPNCHAMIHRTSRTLTVEELKSIINPKNQ